MSVCVATGAAQGAAAAASATARRVQEGSRARQLRGPGGRAMGQRAAPAGGSPPALGFPMMAT
jgi:hypothetical protein